MNANDNRSVTERTAGALRVPGMRSLSTEELEKAIEEATGAEFLARNLKSLGPRLSVRVTTRARRDEVIGWREGVLRVRVRAAPEKGKANEAVCALIAKAMGLPRRAVMVEQGHTSRDKVLSVRDRGEKQGRPATLQANAPSSPTNP